MEQKQKADRWLQLHNCSTDSSGHPLSYGRQSAKMSNNEDSSSLDDDWDGSPSRIIEQLEILQSLVPDLAKGNKRSILEGARDYLERVERETEQIQKEVSEQSEVPEASSSSEGGQIPRILHVETEELTEGRFAVKIAWRSGLGVAGNVQRVLEDLNVEITSSVVTTNGPQQMLSMAFLKVEKESQMTEEGLYDLIIAAAKRSGLLL